MVCPVQPDGLTENGWIKPWVIAPILLSFLNGRLSGGLLYVPGVFRVPPCSDGQRQSGDQR